MERGRALWVALVQRDARVTHQFRWLRGIRWVTGDTDVCVHVQTQTGQDMQTRAAIEQAPGDAQHGFGLLQAVEHDCELVLGHLLQNIAQPQAIGQAVADQPNQLAPDRPAEGALEHAVLTDPQHAQRCRRPQRRGMAQGGDHRPGRLALYRVLVRTGVRVQPQRDAMRAPASSLRRTDRPGKREYVVDLAAQSAWRGPDRQGHDLCALALAKRTVGARGQDWFGAVAVHRSVPLGRVERLSI